MNLHDTITNLKTMLPASNFVVTGSYTLAKYGLRKMEDVKDLDIILVNPTPAAIELINGYMKDFPAYTTEKFKAIAVPEKTNEEVKDPYPQKKPEKTRKNPNPTFNYSFRYFYVGWSKNRYLY
jgi:hypothetical protein